MSFGRITHKKSRFGSGIYCLSCDWPRQILSRPCRGATAPFPKEPLGRLQPPLEKEVARRAGGFDAAYQDGGQRFTAIARDFPPNTNYMKSCLVLGFAACLAMCRVKSSVALAGGRQLLFQRSLWGDTAPMGRCRYISFSECVMKNAMLRYAVGCGDGDCPGGSVAVCCDGEGEAGEAAPMV